MSIADYTSLAAAIKAYAARSDSTFSTQIENFVGLAEGRLYDGHGHMESPLYSAPLRTQVMETTGTITATDGVATVPANYLAMRSIFRSGDTEGLRFMAPERANVRNAIEGAGLPSFYKIEGRTLTLVPAWSGDLSILYWKRFDPVTVAAPTNSLIAAHGLVYLEACLIEAFSFLQAGDLAAGHAEKLRGMIAGLNRTASKLRTSGPLRVRQRAVIG